MPGGTKALLVAGHEALVAGEWSTARGRFEAALEQEETAEALNGLGIALGWLDEIDASLRYRERAYAEFRRRPDPVQAAVIAMQLSSQYASSLGNLAASRGWLGRFERMVEQFELPTAMQAWVLLCRASLASASDDPHAALGYGREALELAQRVTDAPGPNAELCALSEIGAALVEIGRVEEGTALLDEAMAASLAGEDESPDTVVYTSCKTVIACARATEVSRARRWIRAADEFNRNYGSPHVYILCRLHYGSVLLATGQWAEAEREFRAALEKMPKTAEPRLHVEVLAKLAELRVSQGRIEDAVRLLDGLEDNAATSYALGSIHLARGEFAVAASILGRRARELGEECLQCAPLLELLIQVEIEQGKLRTAAARARRLAAFGTRLDCDVIVARGERAVGRVLVGAAKGDQARPHLERALEAFARLETPLELARTRLLLARAVAEVGARCRDRRRPDRSRRVRAARRDRRRRFGGRLPTFAGREAGSHRSEGARCADQARVRGAATAGRGPFQPRDGRAHVHHPQDRRESRRQRALQVGVARPWRGGGLRGSQPRARPLSSAEN